MRCQLILLITEHPIQQGIRKGGVRYFGHEDGRTEWRILGSWIMIMMGVVINDGSGGVEKVNNGGGIGVTWP